MVFHRGSGVFQNEDVCDWIRIRDQNLERCQIGNAHQTFEDQLPREWYMEEPRAESVIRGSREGFLESLSDNTAMLRRSIKSPSLKFKPFTIGRLTRTQVWVAYVDGIANPDLVREAADRLLRIETDDMLESGNIEELIKDDAYSPFPLLQSTERPDVVSSALLEGRIAILTEGTPFVLIAPTTLPALLQSPDDYYQTFYFGTAIRWLRYLFMSIALLGPSAYIAVASFHQEMIPSALFLTIAKSREEIPFPVVVEGFIMELIFEAIREAGTRLPKQTGAAVSIVGALVIGEAATAAGIVSFPIVMIVALSGIASFMVPSYTTGITIRMLRFPMMILSGFLGLLGLILGILMTLAHLCKLRSFGVPYLTPIAPMIPGELSDVVIKAPYWMHDEHADTKENTSTMRHED